MGKLSFSKVIKFFAFALLGAATAIAAVVALSSPADAAEGGGGVGRTPKPWDTDNLRYAGGQYSARSFNVPFHRYGGYSGVAACQSGVADAFFQAGGSVGAVNDFPYLDWVAVGDSGSWVEQQGGTRNKGCDEFVEQQDEMAAQIGSNGGYYLDLSGNLQKLSEDPPSRFSSRRLPYSHWLRKGDAFAVNSDTGELIASQDTSGYWVRVDGRKTGPNKYYLAIYPSGTTWTIPENTQNGRFGNWHGTSYQRRTDSAVLTRVARPAEGITRFSYLLEAGLCPAGFHPRGEDSVDRIGSHTGRTLTGLTHAQGSIADRFWCRSDLRFGRRFHPEFHTGVAKHRQAATKEFTAYGRLNCYFTAFTSGSHGGAEGIRKDPSGGMVCSYLFPIPQCDPDPDNGSSTDWRDYTAAEVAIAGTVGQPFNKASGADCGENTPQCTHNGAKRDMTDAELAEYRKDDASFTPKADGTTPCVKSAAPQQQAGFTADPCVTASLEIYENRIVGSAAEPGVPATDRTLAVATGRTAWDLDITSPHPFTASAPRRTSDATGCADGSEDRAYHSTLPGHANRKQSPAPSYASSTRTNNAAPPNDLEDDIDYSGAVKNIAHRYASNVAENTCAAKRAEAELVLALGKARADMFSRGASGSDLGGYAARYYGELGSNLKLFTNASPKGFLENLDDDGKSVDHSVHGGFWLEWFNADKSLRVTYGTNMKNALTNFRSALAAARTAYISAVSGASLRAYRTGSCVSHWDSEMSRVRKAFTDAETAFDTAIASHESVLSRIARPNATASPYTTDSVSQGAVSADPRVSTKTCLTAGYSLNTAKTQCVRSWRVRITYTGTPYQACLAVFPGGDCSGQPKTGSIQYVVYQNRSSSRSVDYSYSQTATRTVTYTTTGHYANRRLPISSSCTSSTLSRSWNSNQTPPKWDDGSCTPTKSYSTRYSEAVGSSPALTSTPALAVSIYSTKPAPTPIHKLALLSEYPANQQPPAITLLGKYDPLHTDRNNLKSPTAPTRDTAAANLGTLTEATSAATYTPRNFASAAVGAKYGLSSLRTDVENKADNWTDAYMGTAYDTAYAQATTDMGTIATTSTWNNFDWRYHSPSLAWGNYQEDPATTYSASTATPKDGTGCDLVSVASDGTVSVEATRLDYEGVPLGSPTAASRYGVGDIFGVRTDAQRTCKIRRTRTPELLLEYQPSRPSGTDTSKAASSFYVNYQPTVPAGQPAAERFKLYDEAEVFAVKTSLADRAPVLCYQPGEALVAHVGARGIDAVSKAVFRNASGFRGGNKKHCYRPPSLEQLGSPPLPLPRPKPKPAFAFFDDTAHSAMASVNVVWQQPTPKIVSKLGSTDHLKMMANTVALEASNAVAYDDATRTSSFYGTYYTFPTDNSVKSPSGWDITGHPTLTLASTFTQHQVQAKDTAAKTPTTQPMVFKFVDCVFGIEDVAFVDNIASPYALLSDENGVVPAGWKQTYDRDPHNSPTWYYPAFSTYESALRLDGRRDSNGTPITYGRNTQGGFAHPSTAPLSSRHIAKFLGFLLKARFHLSDT